MNSFWILFCFTDLPISGSYVPSCYYYFPSPAHLPSSKTSFTAAITGICRIVDTSIAWLPAPILGNNSAILVQDTVSHSAPSYTFGSK